MKESDNLKKLINPKYELRSMDNLLKSYDTDLKRWSSVVEYAEDIVNSSPELVSQIEFLFRAYKESEDVII